MKLPVKLIQIAGKVMRKDNEIILIFRIGKKYFPATEYNRECMETYWHTGNEQYLSKLENELEA